jgi:hypothetical protein
MKKSIEQLKADRDLLWITLSNCQTALSMANEAYLPESVKRFVEMGLKEAQFALEKTRTQEAEEES